MRDCLNCKYENELCLEGDFYKCMITGKVINNELNIDECFESPNDEVFKFKLGQTVFYLEDNKIHSGEIFARQLIENIYSKHYACTEEQQKFYIPFGDEGKYYNVQCAGIMYEDKIFETKEELVKDLLK